MCRNHDCPANLTLGNFFRIFGGFFSFRNLRVWRLRIVLGCMFYHVKSYIYVCVHLCIYPYISIFTCFLQNVRGGFEHNCVWSDISKNCNNISNSNSIAESVVVRTLLICFFWQKAWSKLYFLGWAVQSLCTMYSWHVVNKMRESYMVSPRALPFEEKRNFRLYRSSCFFGCK